MRLRQALTDSASSLAAEAGMGGRGCGAWVPAGSRRGHEDLGAAGLSGVGEATCGQGRGGGSPRICKQGTATLQPRRAMTRRGALCTPPCRPAPAPSHPPSRHDLLRHSAAAVGARGRREAVKSERAAAATGDAGVPAATPPWCGPRGAAEGRPSTEHTRWRGPALLRALGVGIGQPACGELCTEAAAGTVRRALQLLVLLHQELVPQTQARAFLGAGLVGTRRLLLQEAQAQAEAAALLGAAKLQLLLPGEHGGGGHETTQTRRTTLTPARCDELRCGGGSVATMARHSRY
ncbi:hypothetical protein E2C01_058203 [Portunus trituberculatus]|uniref:Uncharacterized protein n=1 Tax=Portunus trituberculatus TaxID=210409 RepID=A0A5B7GZ76_PORTR|nr:hypothetical protein [Portunus trituberculatus]